VPSVLLDASLKEHRKKREYKNKQRKKGRRERGGGRK